MAVLTKNQIKESIANGSLAFDPVVDGFQLQPHAIDLRLGYKYYIPKTWKLTAKGREALNVDYLNYNGDVEYFEIIEIKSGQCFEILPKEFVIVSTLEKIHLNSENIMGVLYPRTSINRRGLSIELSGIVDVGYQGYLMIPIVNNTTTQIIKLYPGERFCQVVLQNLADNISKEEAMKHGLSTAKYVNASDGELKTKPDKSEEMDLIRSGKLDELKTKYKI